MGMNGIITINGTMDQQNSFNLGAFPHLTPGVSYLAPFWADTNGYHIGSMKARESQNINELQRVKDVVLQANTNLFGFNAEYMFVGDWIDVTPCGCFFPVSVFK